jgi:pantoate--beta-alanine ligase
MLKMKIINTINKTREVIDEVRKAGITLGFVPTMGALHQGHLALVNKAKKENDLVVCSIFVNPIQFNNPSDLLKYPLTLEQDIDLLVSVGCDILFCPDEKEMYPEPESKVYDLGDLDMVMEGKFRPGHFNGVAVVVKKLFDIILPDRAYFGEKDFQQLAVIKALVRNEHLDVQIVPCPTEREPDGLAMSSRNTRLTPGHRAKAPMIYQTLLKAKEMLNSTPPSKIKSWVENVFCNEPEARLEYFEIADAETLLPVSENDRDKKLVGCIAVFFGEVRLIDNIVFNS